MHIFKFALIPALIFFLFLLFPAGSLPGAESASPPSGNPLLSPTGDFTFGSEAILRACWTEEELRGSPEDKKDRPAPPGYSGPPERTEPKNRRAPLPPELRNSIRSVQPPEGEKILALTFDLCESSGEISGYDAGVVNYLRENGVPATFFMGGRWMRDHPEKALQLMTDPLFEIGNHTWSHKNLRKRTLGKIKEEILWTQAEYEVLREKLAARTCAQNAGQGEREKIPALPLTFRFPFGTCKPGALKFLADSGLPAIQWSLVADDRGDDHTAAQLARIILREARPGVIVVLHANGHGYHTAEALPRLIPELRKAGYEFVTVTGLLTRAREVSNFSDCFELKPGDNYRYDFITGVRALPPQRKDRMGFPSPVSSPVKGGDGGEKLR
ncbi:MAG: polysaccharide deacetylase family protein [Proteobacteria bacterium]|nr:polysaccharide deacetylase family protein [Pseudomonadota bacterium]